MLSAAKVIFDRISASRYRIANELNIIRSCATTASYQLSAFAAPLLDKVGMFLSLGPLSRPRSCFRIPLLSRIGVRNERLLGQCLQMTQRRGDILFWNTVDTERNDLTAGID